MAKTKKESSRLSTIAKTKKESTSRNSEKSGSPKKQAPQSPSSKQPGRPKRKVPKAEGKKVATKPDESSSKNSRKRPRDENSTEIAAKETSVGEESRWSKSKKKRMRHLKAKKNKSAAGSSAADDKEQTHDVDKSDNILSPVAALEEQKQLIQSPKETTELKKSTHHQSSLQKSFQERLSGSRFRVLNEELYTTTSHAAFERFSRQPELFDEYHAGFRHQVEHWPVNPVQVLVEKLKQQQQQAQVKNLVVADFGCGDADLAKQLLQSNGDEFTVHSFDLVARGPNADLITTCDCADRVPLPSQSVDVGIFCLALMGTNLADFVREAHRVLKADGCLHIAEVRSRFEGSSTNNNNTKTKQKGKGDKDPLQVFIATLEKLGFSCVEKDRSNKMFVLLELKKNGKKPKKDLSFTAKPCIYKRR